MTRSSQRGFSLMEILFVLVIIIGAAGLIVAQAFRAHASANIQASVAVARTAMLDIKNLRPNRNYAGLNIAELIRAGKVPAQWQRLNGTAMSGPWGSWLAVHPWQGYSSTATAPNGFLITLEGLSTELCSDMIQSLYPGTYGIINYNAGGTWAYLAEQAPTPSSANIAFNCRFANSTNVLWVYAQAGRL